jgi:hypothetical protein
MTVNGERNMHLPRDIARAIVAAALLCTGAHADVMRFESHVSEPQNVPTDKPELNRAPHKIVTIHGQKDRRIEAWFVMRYSTTNDTCLARTTSQYLSGAPKIAQTISDFVRVSAGQATFSVRFALDRYAPGRCGWTPIAIGRAEFLPEESRGPGGISGFATIRQDGSEHIAKRYRCRPTVASSEAKPDFYLECLVAASSTHARSDISANGATADVEFRLDTSAPQQAPKPVAPPARSGI